MDSMKHILNGVAVFMLGSSIPAAGQETPRSPNRDGDRHAEVTVTIEMGTVGVAVSRYLTGSEKQDGSMRTKSARSATWLANWGMTTSGSQATSGMAGQVSRPPLSQDICMH